MPGLMESMEEYKLEMPPKILASYTKEGSEITFLMKEHLGFVRPDKRGHAKQNYEVPCFIRTIIHNDVMIKNTYAILVLSRITFLKMLGFNNKTFKKKQPYFVSFVIKNQNQYVLKNFDKLIPGEDDKDLVTTDTFEKRFELYLEKVNYK